MVKEVNEVVEIILDLVSDDSGDRILWPKKSKKSISSLNY